MDVTTSRRLALHAALTITRPVGWRLTQHRHRHHEMLLVQEGAYAVSTSAGATVLRPGEAILHPAGVPHAVGQHGTRPLRLAVLCWGGLLPLGAGAQVQDAEGRLGILHGWLAQAWQTGEDEGMVMHLLALARGEFLRLHRRRYSDLARIVRAHVQAHPRDPCTVEALARLTGLPISTFAHRFRQEVGLPPKRFIMRTRLLLARELLVTGDQRMNDIAHACGFADASHLVHAFRRIFGHAPGRLRNLVGEVEH